jgi:tetratricopeptide (TPR) repeat protein
VVGYAPPPDTFLARLQKSLQGFDTVRALTERHAKDPDNIEVAFKLALKYDDQYPLRDKAKELFEKVIALDPEGKAGATKVERVKDWVGYTEYAELALAQRTAYGRTPDLAPLRAFIKKYPESPLKREAYIYYNHYFSRAAPKEEAAKFFEEFAAQFPNDPTALSVWISKIVRDKEPIDKGLELAERVRELTKYNPIPYYTQDYAHLHLLKGNKEMADSLYGKEFFKSQVGSLAGTLVSYAQFWLDQKANLASAQEAVELALKVSPDVSYVRDTAATFYVKTGKLTRALEIYGPAHAKQNTSNGAELYRYAWFWNQQGENLKSALEAAKKSVELEPTHYRFDILGQIQLKLKDLDGAVKSAEKALALAKEQAARTPDYPVKRYEDNLKKAQDAKAKK